MPVAGPVPEPPRSPPAAGSTGATWPTGAAGAADREPRVRGKWIVAVCGLVAAVLVGVAVSWVELRPTPSTRMYVGLTHRVSCTGTTVQRAVMVANEDPASIAVVAPTMRCRIDLSFFNLGPHSATLGRVMFPGLGSDSTAPVRIIGPGQVAAGDTTDETFEVTRALAVRKRVLLTYWMVFRSTGCAAQGRVESRLQVPVVTLSVGGHDQTVRGRAILAWRGSTLSSCPAGG